MLDYTTIGKGEAIFLIHGFCEDHTIWDNIVNALQDKYKFILPDLPGFGNSSIDDNKNTIADWAISIKQIFDKEGIKRTIMIGHSLGGYVSLAFAKKYPQLLIGLELFHSTAFADNTEKVLMRKRILDFLKKNPSDGFVNELIPKLFATSYLKRHTDIVEKIKKNAFAYSNEALILSTNAMMYRPDLTSILKGTTFPISFIIGSEDTTYPASEILQQVAMPCISHISVLKDVGHMGMLEAPKESINALEEFVEYCLKRPTKASPQQ